MNLSQEEINHLKEAAGDIGVALFQSKDAGATFKCLLSNTEQLYKEEESFSIYQLKPVQRIVGRKLDIYTNTLQKELSQGDQQVPAIITWESSERVVLIFSLDSQTITETVSKRIEEIKSLFDELLEE